MCVRKVCFFTQFTHLATARHHKPFVARVSRINSGKLFRIFLKKTQFTHLFFKNFFGKSIMIYLDININLDIDIYIIKG